MRNNINLILESAVEIELKNAYENIFEQYRLWTTNGINESNLTHQFSEAMRKSLKDDKSFVCFEQALKEKRKRIDGIVYSPAQESIFFVESKRFKRSQPKYEDSLDRDIERILEDDNRNSILKNLKSDKKQIKQYCVFIADHWKLNNSQERVEKWFSKHIETNKYIRIYYKSFTCEGVDSNEKYMIFAMVLKIK